MDDNHIHVSPIVGNELREHDTSHKGDCWCKPKPIYEGNGVIWVHSNLPAPKRHAGIAKSA